MNENNLATSAKYFVVNQISTNGDGAHASNDPFLPDGVLTRVIFLQNIHDLTI